MKKLLAILLAALMIFSVTTVAFAEGEAENNDAEVVETEGEGTSEAEEEFDFMDLPIWTIKVGGHAGKIFLKIALVVVKLLSKLGFIDATEMIQGLIDQIQGNEADTPVDSGETAEPVADPVAA